MASGCPRILLVEDDPTSREVLRAILDFEGYPIDEASDGVEAVQKLEAGAYQVVVADYHMPRMNGLHLLHYIRRYRPTTPVILLSAEAIGEIAIRNGAYAWLPKPYEVSAFIQTVRQAVSGTRPALGDTAGQGRRTGAGEQ